MSNCCLMSNEQFFSYIVVGTCFILMRWWWCPLCTRQVELDFYSASSLKQVRGCRPTDTLFWFWVKQTLLLLLDTVCLAEKQHIPILQFLVWPNQGSNPRSTTLEVSMLNHQTTYMVFMLSWICWPHCYIIFRSNLLMMKLKKKYGWMKK